MANSDDNTTGHKKRGLGSASKSTVQRVAKMGGKAHHNKRGRSGSDNA